MNLRDLIPWVLAGSLAASTFANFYLLDRIDKLDKLDAGAQTEASKQTRGITTTRPVVLPIRIVTRLGLTKQQCEMIEGCTMT